MRVIRKSWWTRPKKERPENGAKSHGKRRTVRTGSFNSSLVTSSGGRTRSITRRSLLITGASPIGSCFVPSWLLRRAGDFEKTSGGIYIEAPDSPRNTLYAVDQGYHFQFALSGRTDELPPQFTWREYFRDHTEVDLDDHLDVRKWLREEGAYYFDRDNLRYVYRRLHFLDEQVDDRIWENYLEGLPLSNTACASWANPRKSWWLARSPASRLRFAPARHNRSSFFPLSPKLNHPSASP